MQSSTDTLKKKIFIETSALIAASVHITLPEGEAIQDEFYAESTELFSIIKKYFDSRIGITTKTVEKEAKEALMDAVTSTLEEGAPEQAESFEAKSHHWNVCMSRLEDYVSYLSIEPAPRDLVEPIEIEVSKMYKELAARRKPFWKLKQEAQEEIEKDKARFRGNQRSMADQFEIIYGQMVRHHYQLHRLYFNAASKNDRQILAEAVLIYQHYSGKQPGFQLLLASCDSNNFCPCLNKEYGLSTTVTDAIHRQFKVKCERPKELIRILREELEPLVEEVESEDDDKEEESGTNSEENRNIEMDDALTDEKDPTDKPPYMS